MTFSHAIDRRIRAAAATAGFLVLAASAHCGTEGLVTNSPFLPQSAVAQSGNSGVLDKYELRGVASFGGVPTFSIYDATTNRGFWIPLEASEGGLRVASYDAAREAIVLEGEGGSRRLFLKEAQIQSLVAAPVAQQVFPVGALLPAAAGAMASEQEMAERRQRIIEELRRRRALRQQPNSPATQ